MVISIIGSDGTILARAEGTSNVRLVYDKAFEHGDVISLSTAKDGFVVAQLEDSIAPVLGFLSGEFKLPIPFGEKRVCYSPKSFTGNVHVLWARHATALEVASYRNLALNPLDNHDNTALFPHASANVETRGESVFAAFNAINGNISSSGHGEWPYESWGINRRDDAEITIDFGCDANIDKIVITLRADFPHDNWWKEATLLFSDGSTFTPTLIKSGKPQSFDITPRTVRSVTMKDMIKDESDPSPFPALVQLECWGVPAKFSL